MCIEILICCIVWGEYCFVCLSINPDDAGTRIPRKVLPIPLLPMPWLLVASGDLVALQLFRKYRNKRYTTQIQHDKNEHEALQWRYNELDDVSNHRRLHCVINRLFRRRSQKTSQLRVAGLCEGNSPLTDEFTTQKASYTENVSIVWLHHEFPWQRTDKGMIVNHRWKP